MSNLDKDYRAALSSNYSIGIPSPEPAMIKWQQLAQDCINSNKDFYTELASRVHKIPYETVTAEQRAEAKEYMRTIIYSRGELVLPPLEFNKT